jgi:hypothetical protein
VFKKATARFSFLLLFAVLISPVSRVHAQSTDSARQTDVVTGSDLDPIAEPDVIKGTARQPAGEQSTDVITGTDPEPTGEPHGGANMLQALAIATFITFRLS